MSHDLGHEATIFANYTDAELACYLRGAQDFWASDKAERHRLHLLDAEAERLKRGLSQMDISYMDLDKIPTIKRPIQ